MITVAVITSKFPLEKLFLKSIDFADEIIIEVDSVDKIKKSANKKIKLFTRALNGDFSAQRNFALSKASSEWVLFVDDDEYVGSELAREIKEITKDSSFSGFNIKRVDTVFHQPLTHGETGNIKLLRLARKDSGKFVRPVHEVWKVKGRVGETLSPLYHIKDHFVSGFLGRMDQYGKIDSKILSQEGKPFSYFRLLLNPIGKFKLNYFLRLGFLDGVAGLFSAYLMSVQSLSIRVFQWENRD